MVHIRIANTVPLQMLCDLLHFTYKKELNDIFGFIVFFGVFWCFCAGMYCIKILTNKQNDTAYRIASEQSTITPSSRTRHR